MDDDRPIQVINNRAFIQQQLSGLRRTDMEAHQIRPLVNNSGRVNHLMYVLVAYLKSHYL